TNALREKMLKDFSKNPPYDEFGMLPFLDELIGVDWIIDINKYDFAYDEAGDIIRALDDDVLKGKLKDPRDIDSTPESRWEFEYKRDAYKNGMLNGYGDNIPSDWTQKEVKLWLDTLVLQAKLAALTPPQGYPNAPYYFSPERLEFIYKKHKLDRLKDPRIPAIYRYNFPEDLRAKILAYAK
ncbi:hypothetical protein KJQ85_08875, partial [Campylobacter lari]|nr:hypothetical protein [Campylobacter lari]